jgi:hypothetical protein
VVGKGFYNYPVVGGFVQAHEPEYNEDKPRLTFTAKDVLTAWSKH